MKTALITGATKGIGLELARELAERGYQVWLTGRNEYAGVTAAQSLRDRHLDVQFLHMDVAQIDSIREASQTVFLATQRLDVLVNNAGVLLDESLSILTVSPELVQETMQINALGALYVTQAFTPLLSSGSRVVNVSSGAGQISKGMSAYSPIYSVSKTALNAITCQLAHALKSKGVAVNAVSPGWVRTDMGGPAAPRSAKKGVETPLWLATEAPLAETGKFWYDKEVIPW
jgi:NAD(P)-dependent dehydrogenase (short-subunit alcohol dehydrogenase family)